MVWDIMDLTALLKVPSNLTLNIFNDEDQQFLTATCSINIVKYAFIISYLNLPSFIFKLLTCDLSLQACKKSSSKFTKSLEFVEKPW